MALIKYLPEIAGFLIFIMMSTQYAPVGPILILLEIGLVGLLFATRPQAFLEIVTRWWPLLLTPFLATLSALWSDAPAASFRYGAQFFFTAFVGVLLARLMSARTFITVFMISAFVFCILCILHGRQGTSVEGMVLIGLTGSKNQMGYEGQLLLMSAVAVLMMGAASLQVRWIAMLSLPVSLYILLETNSATAVVSAAGGTIALLGLAFSQRLTPGARLATLAGVIMVMIPLLLLLPEARMLADHFLYDTLEKDPTLTGRTFLWAAADDLISRRPFLGYGYSAIWMGDSSETIGLYRLAGITDGRVYHFHHQFRQIAVDTGFIGLLTFVGVLVAVAFASIRRVLLRPDVASSFFFIIFLLLVVRCFADVIVGPFSIHALMFYACCVYAFTRTAPAPVAAAPAPSKRFAWQQRGARAIR